MDLEACCKFRLPARFWWRAVGVQLDYLTIIAPKCCITFNSEANDGTTIAHNTCVTIVVQSEGRPISVTQTKSPIQIINYLPTHSLIRLQIWISISSNYFIIHFQSTVLTSSIIQNFYPQRANVVIFTTKKRLLVVMTTFMHKTFTEQTQILVTHIGLWTQPGNHLCAISHYIAIHELVMV